MTYNKNLRVFNAVITAFALSLAVGVSAATQNPVYLSPDQDIKLPDSESAVDPLVWLGANSPWFAGPNINGVSNDVPEVCEVEQAAYVVRHGSRFPDTGAYAQWTTLYAKIQAANFTAKGSMAFLKDWKPVLTNPTAQIAQESPTGWKEAFDLGYRLRTRYPDLYTDGTPFISWANLYPRVVQTAQNFVRGFLGNKAASLGTVITVNSTGSLKALFNSLSPSDLCPNFVDGNGGTEATEWAAIYLPPITARLNALTTGNLTFLDSDTAIFPYLCGFESQITGTLSPWCSTFTNDELRSYEYAQDLRYYYGLGDGVDLPSKMMLPFLHGLVDLIADGPNQNGTAANGSSYAIPNILTAFLNDGQITELVAATGVMSDQSPLIGSEIPEVWKYISSHFVSMRGTVAFERLNCKVSVSGSGSNGAGAEKVKRGEERWTTVTETRTTSTCLESPTAGTGSGSDSGHGSDSLDPTTSLSSYLNSTISTLVSSTTGPYGTSNSSTTAPLGTGSSTSVTTSTLPTSSSISSPPSTNQIYIRILLNDAFYPVPSCNSGPGKSCLLSTYVDIIAKSLENQGNLRERCNVTAANSAGAGNGTSGLGTGFFKDLSGENSGWLASVAP